MMVSWAGRGGDPSCAAAEADASSVRCARVDPSGEMTPEKKLGGYDRSLEQLDKLECFE